MKTTVERIPAGQYENCTVLISDRRANLIFIKHGEKIYANRSTDLTRLFAANDEERRAYSKLSGIPVKAMKEAARANALSEKKKREQDAVAYARRVAARSGYKLTKIRAPK